MGYRINERNTGDHTLEGGAKMRRKAKAKLSERGHLHDDSVWTDGGRFIISLTGKQKNDLFDIIHERKF